MVLKLKQDSLSIKRICLLISLSFFAASFAATIYLNVWGHVLKDFFKIITSPSPLVTDYFRLGNLASAFLNAGLCGISCTLLMYLLKIECRPGMLAGYFLVVAHCFYGLNFLNMWPPVLGFLLFSKVRKVGFCKHFDMAMLSTAFGPFVSELLFRYHVWDCYLPEKIQFSILGLIFTIILCIFLGFTIPAMLPGALKLHKGYNLYNGGLAFGLLGFLIYAFLYKTMGIQPPQPEVPENIHYALHGNCYQLFVSVYFLLLFVVLLLWGWHLNGNSFRGYRKLLNSTGHSADFFAEFGTPKVLINLGFYGFLIFTYFTLVVSLTDGAGFTGPTLGIIFAAMTFSAQGQHPANVWPIFIGYALLSILVTVLCNISGLPIPWTLSTQGYLNGAAFATGLCPIVGKYGRKYGIIAGFLCAILCTSTNALHGGFMLYNGGLTTGITALILIPMLEYYCHPKNSLL